MQCRAPSRPVVSAAAGAVFVIVSAIALVRLGATLVWIPDPPPGTHGPFGETIDYFGRDIEVPDGMNVLEPIHEYTDWQRAEAESMREQMKRPLTVAVTGIGRYRVYGSVPVAGSGVLYLRATEAVHGTPLSESTVREVSSVHVVGAGSGAEPVPVPYDRTIVIAEGDPAYPYPGRVELWFKPDSGGEEQRLYEGVYWIEGWER